MIVIGSAFADGAEAHAPAQAKAAINRVIIICSKTPGIQPKRRRCDPANSAPVRKIGANIDEHAIADANCVCQRKVGRQNLQSMTAPRQ
ncbi:MAG: hypothetical protein IPF57_09995 [Gammaproteobacteria bacterium]|nr:hypothetical protein [Gammaproteobacteria bacterium]MBK9467597.1 hypothetical protein [Gammaproteobacteria bacterium]MBP6481204.1 hypothetical protein [Pseudomonadales bacterium]